jgi:hypothetical protein
MKTFGFKNFLFCLALLGALSTLSACGGGGSLDIGGGSSGGGGGIGSSDSDESDGPSGVGMATVSSRSQNYETIMTVGESLPLSLSISESGVYEMQTKINF